MAHLSDMNIIIQIFEALRLIGIFNELDEELVEVRLDIDTLKLGVHVLIDEHKVGVDFEAAILPDNQSDVVLLIVFRIRLDYSTILQNR